MNSSLFLVLIAVSLASAELLGNLSNPQCIYGSEIEHHFGQLSSDEVILQTAFMKICSRPPTMTERIKLYNPIKTRELSVEELEWHLSYLCKSSPVLKETPWAERMPGMVYTWTVDFHPAPSACNIPIYREIGVVIHPEIDHNPFCEYNGFCRNRLKSIFGLGQMMVGFSLDPDHAVLKRDFYEAYKDDPEFNRADVFMCSHPGANCELFEKFGKPMILFATTRLEFGRNDQNIVWRRREIARWNAWGELVQRQREWMEFILRYYQSGLLAVTANSMYDVEYIYYFTGVRPIYIPSWCGDLDGSYGRRTEWVGCMLNDTTVYSPHINETLFIPYKQPLWFYKGDGIDEQNSLYIDFNNSRQEYINKYNEEPPVIKHSLQEISNHSPEVYKKYRALVIVPYQSSTMTFFELYRQNIPIFAPSINLLIDWHQKYNFLSPRIYGNPKRDLDLISISTGQPANLSIPDPNNDKDIDSNRYWFPLFDIYVFDHVQYFDSWIDLFEKLSTNAQRGGVDFEKVSKQMAEYNQKSRNEISNRWSTVFKKLVPNPGHTIPVNVTEIQQKIQFPKI